MEILEQLKCSGFYFSCGAADLKGFSRSSKTCVSDLKQHKFCLTTVDVAQVHLPAIVAL